MAYSQCTFIRPHSLSILAWYCPIDTVLFGMEIPDRITSSRAMHSIVRAEEFDTHLLRCVHYILHGDDSGETAPRQFAHRCWTFELGRCIFCLCAHFLLLWCHHSDSGVIGGATVISIGLLAIAQHQQTSGFVHWSALCGFLSMLTILQSVFCNLIYRSDSGYYSHDPRPAKRTSSWNERGKCSASPIVTFYAHSTIYSI